MLDTITFNIGDKQIDERLDHEMIKRLSIHELANAMLSCGYTGQNLKNPDANVYIVLASENPDVESELPDRGFVFWDIARFKFELWVTMRRLRRAKEAR
jgi:hypothetical protein